jgi:hypothetical protein
MCVAEAASQCGSRAGRSEVRINLLTRCVQKPCESSDSAIGRPNKSHRAAPEDAMSYPLEFAFFRQCVSDVHHGACLVCKVPLVRRPARYRGEVYSTSAIAQVQARARQQAG